MHEADRTAGIVLADHDYFDNLLNTLPDKYQVLTRQGMYGDFFSFYICDMLLQAQRQGRPAGVRQAGRPAHRAVHAANEILLRTQPVGHRRVGIW